VLLHEDRHALALVEGDHEVDGERLVGASADVADPLAERLGVEPRPCERPEAARVRDGGHELGRAGRSDGRLYDGDPPGHVHGPDLSDARGRRRPCSSPRRYHGL
jgi:hypothetical protein